MVPGFLCGIELTGHTQQIPTEYHTKILVPGEILGKIQRTVFFQTEGLAVLQHVGHKLGAEVVIFSAEGKPQHKADDNTQLTVAQLILVILKRTDELLRRQIGVAADIQCIQGTGERLSAGLVIAGNTFYDKTFVYKAVEGIRILFQTDRCMGIGKAGPQTDGMGIPTGELGQQDIDFLIFIHVYYGLSRKEIFPDWLVFKFQ